MKRILKYFIFIILLLPLNVKAYGIENYFVNATLKDNGDLLVEEYFYLNGDYNGFERIINYNNEKAYPFDPNMDFYGGSTLHNGSGIILHEIRALDIETDFDFTNINGDKFHEVSSADRGDYGVYTIDSTMNGASYKVYLPDYKNKAFYLKYTLVNMAIYHNDVGELGFNIVGDKLSESVNNFKAYVNFPSNKGKLLGWAHGPLKGKINILNNQKLEVTINDLYSYTSIDVRATFDKDIISNSKKRSNVSALDKILKYEESKANQANYERQNEEKLRQIEAEESLNYLEEHLDRYNYNRATTKVLNVSNLEKRKTYLQRLNDLKKLLDVKEEKEAYESVEWAEHYISYYEYNNALEKVKVLDNEKIKTELNNRLKTVKEKIIEKEKKLEKRNYILGGILYLVVFIIAIYIYYKYDKEFKSEFNQTYLRDFPSDFSPTTVAYLFKRKITNDSLSATILDLIRKKAIRYESNGDKNYILYNESSNISNLSSTEKRLIDLIFDDRDKVDLKTLKKYAEKHYSSFSSNWTSFKKAAENEAKSEELFIDNSNKKIWNLKIR